jgi:hypothetical protein
MLFAAVMFGLPALAAATAGSANKPHRSSTA